MTKYVTTVLDGNGVELNVTYSMEYVPSHVEEGHGYHQMGNYHDIELESVELDLLGISIDILPQLTNNQIDSICEFISSQL